MGKWFNDQPYTSFANVNAKKGRVKLTDGEGSGNSVVIEALSLSADRTISVRDSNGSIVVSTANTTVLGNNNLLTLDTANLSAARTVGFMNVGGSLLVGLAGTMNVDLPSTQASSFDTTAITITGLNSNDVITWGLADGASGSITVGIVPIGAMAAANTATLIFANVNAVEVVSHSFTINYQVIKL